MNLRPAILVAVVLGLAGCGSSDLPPATTAANQDITVDRPPSPELLAVLARSETLPQSGVENQQVARRVIITPRRPVRARRVAHRAPRARPAANGNN